MDECLDWYEQKVSLGAFTREATYLLTTTHRQVSQELFVEYRGRYINDIEPNQSLVSQCAILCSWDPSRLGSRIRPIMLRHQEAGILVDWQLESVASFEVVEFLGAPTLVDAVNCSLVETLGLRGRDHALQLPFRLCALESGVARVPELPLTHGFPFWEGVAAEIAQDDLLKKTLRRERGGGLSVKCHANRYAESSHSCHPVD